MNSLHRQRCFHHAAREAAVRCPSCARHFCRECAVEHHGRVLCAECLARASAVSASRSRRWAGLGWSTAAAAGVLFGWLAIYYAGALLSRIPAEFQGVSGK